TVWVRSAPGTPAGLGPFRPAATGPLGSFWRAATGRLDSRLTRSFGFVSAPSTETDSRHVKEHDQIKGWSSTRSARTSNESQREKDSTRIGMWSAGGLRIGPVPDGHARRDPPPRVS